MRNKAPNYVRITEVAKRLGVSRQMVYKFMNAGRLGELVNGHWRITPRQLSIFKMKPRKPGRPGT